MRAVSSHRPRAWAALLFVTVFAVSQLFAQAGERPSPDVATGHRDPIFRTAYTDAAEHLTVQPDTTRGTISADFLRHPIRAKVRRMLQKAWEAMNSANHEAAIAQLEETLAKYPDSAAYVHSLLGVEYLRTDRFTAAASSFKQAVLLLPHDAWNHYNYGLSLACMGDYDRGEQEVRRALELDPKNTSMQPLLSALLQRKHSAN